MAKEINKTELRLDVNIEAIRHLSRDWGLENRMPAKKHLLPHVRGIQFVTRTPILLCSKGVEDIYCCEPWRKWNSGDKKILNQLRDLTNHLVSSRPWTLHNVSTRIPLVLRMQASAVILVSTTSAVQNDGNCPTMCQLTGQRSVQCAQIHVVGNISDNHGTWKSKGAY